MLNISFPSNFTANYLMIALPMLLTSVLLGSAAEDNSMLKERFAVHGTMTSSLPKFGNLTRNKTNDLILNLTPENVTQHSRIE